MFNPLPDLLIFGFFAPTLLRLAVGGALLLAASRIWKRQRHLSPTLFWFDVGFYTIVGLMLIAGYYTQVAALLCAVECFAALFSPKKLSHLIVFSRGTFFFLMLISLSLLLTGAGALAFDLPL